jgi:hypothetical protein
VNQYSRLLQIEVAGEEDDYLLWEAVNVVAVFADPTKQPDAEHLCVALLACIIRERHATEGFGRQRIAEEEDGSVKLMRGTWLQALQAHTIEVATILGRGFALCSFGSGENGNSSGERS